MGWQAGNLDCNGLRVMMRRRLWLAIMTGSIVFAMVASLALFLPHVYTASATLSHEGWALPAAGMRASGAMPAATRLGAITQEVLNPVRLGKLVKDFDLDQGQSTRPLDEVIDGVRNAISLDVLEDGREGAMMFRVSFTGADPQKVRDIANTLASFYVERNVALRERQPSGAASELQAEIAQLKKRLEAQEKEQQKYKERYKDELPAQLDANTQAVERLHDRLQALNEEIARQKDRRAVPASPLAHAETAPNNGANTLDLLNNQAMKLRQQLAELQSRYPAQYPDVEQTKRELATLEERIRLRSRKAGRKNNGKWGVAAHAGSGFQVPAQEINPELGRLEAERKKVQQQLATYQQRINNTPKRELELQALTRQYAALQEQYASLIARQEQIQLTSRPPGGQFQVLAPATSPSSPLGPRRLQLLFVGLVLAVGAALGSVTIWEKFIDTSFHSAAELAAVTKFPVLVTIPRIAVTGESGPWWSRGQAVYLVSLIALLCVVTSAVRYLAVNNTQLAMKFSSKPVSARK